MCPICGARCRCRNAGTNGLCCPCHRHKAVARLMHAAQLELQPEEVMPNPEMILLCGHHASYMCVACGRCSNCCKCESTQVGEKLAMPPLKSTMSLECQDRLRELRRVHQEEYGRQVKGGT